ncbi:MAG TPA: IPExxxVDY family protein [Bacteroidales bacterium]|nr:IPExxxVDY family protein [Bacteroidales bacterium]HRZ49821.1 IPExxxVDY family protein [Bacteroidales bacterium]
MAKRLQLEYSVASDAALLGMVTDLPGYRLVHFVNKTLHFNLVRIPDLTVPLPRLDQPVDYPFFYWFDTDNRMGFSLLANSSNGFPLLGAIRNIDYLLITTGVHNRYNLDRTSRTLRQVEGIRMVQRVNPRALNGFEMIMQNVELHLYKEIPESKLLWSLI